jgi:hypothetical protein
LVTKDLETMRSSVPVDEVRAGAPTASAPVDEPLPASTYAIAAILSGLTVFAIEYVDRVVTLWPSFNGPLEPLTFAAYLAPASIVGTLVGLVCAAALLGGRLVFVVSSRFAKNLPIRFRTLFAMAIAVVALAIALRALSVAFPTAVEQPLLGVLKKINARIVPIPSVVRHFSALYFFGTFAVVAVVVATDRGFALIRRRVARLLFGVVAAVFAVLLAVLYLIDSRVFFGRYELTMHVPAACVVFVLAFLAVVSGLVASVGVPQFIVRFALFAFLATSAMSAYSFATLGSNENLKALLWRRSVLARRAYESVAALSDRDRDGFASIWNGSDADNRDPAISPFAVDIPGNGVDENGIGGDADQPPSDPTPASARAPVARNFLFIAIDTLRADRMSAYGYHRPTSPRIAEWALEGRFFERAYSQGSNTGISFATMQRSTTGRDLFDKTRPTLFGTLERAGFTTAQINARRDDMWLETKRWRKYRRIILDGIETIDHTSGERLWNADSVTNRAIEYLSALPPDTRHATWVHYLDPHEPREKMAPFDFGDSDSDKYDSEVAFADREVGRLLDFLKASRALENTVVVLMADHGESFGEHGMDLHGNRPNDEQIRVPFVLWAPGLKPSTVRTPVAILDIAPTVLACLGLEGLPRAQGISLLDEPPARPIFSETPFNLQDVNFYSYAVTDGEWRYIYDLVGGTKELYDLAHDPLELHNLADSQPERLARLERLLGQWLDRVGTVRPFKESDASPAE